MIRLPGWSARSAQLEIVGLLGLVGVDEDQVERLAGSRRRASAATRARGRCAPRRARRDRRARCCARATSACRGSCSSVTSRPPAGSARASQMVLYPPSVPISRMLRAPLAWASSWQQLALVRRHVDRAAAPPRRSPRSAASSAASAGARRVGEVVVDVGPLIVRHPTFLPPCELSHRAGERPAPCLVRRA